MHPDSCNQCISENENATTPDQEVWVRNTIYTAIKMAIELHKKAKVRADDNLKDCGIRGVVVGASIEILNTLGHKPKDGYVNLGDFEC